MVHIPHVLHLIEVHLSNHFIDLICSHREPLAPLLVNEAINFERIEHFREVGQTLVRHRVQLAHKLEHSIVLIILPLKIQIHHFSDKDETIFE